VSDNVIRFPDGDYYCPNCGGRWFRLVDPFTSVLADVPRDRVLDGFDRVLHCGWMDLTRIRCLDCET